MPLNARQGDAKSKLAQATGGMKAMSISSKAAPIVKYCVCGLPCATDQENCDSCLGKNSIHIEGEILKK